MEEDIRSEATNNRIDLEKNHQMKPRHNMVALAKATKKEETVMEEDVRTEATNMGTDIDKDTLMILEHFWMLL